MGLVYLCIEIDRFFSRLGWGIRECLISYIGGGSVDHRYP